MNSKYFTAPVQHREYMHVTQVVAVCGPHMYSHDTQFVSNLQVFINPCKQLRSYLLAVATLHA